MKVLNKRYLAEVFTVATVAAFRSLVEQKKITATVKTLKSPHLGRCPVVQRNSLTIIAKSSEGLEKIGQKLHRTLF